MCGQISEMINSGIVKLFNRKCYLEAGINRKTLVNALIGINKISEYDYELRKIWELSQLEERPEIVSDLSMCRISNGYIPLWERILSETPFVAATLPVYTTRTKEGEIDPKELLNITIEHMEKGVGLVTIHPTVTKELFLSSQRRLVPITSRGGGIIVKDMIKKGWKSENAYLAILPEIINAAKKNKTVLSIGTTFRSANIFDSFDMTQKEELKLQFKIAEEISKRGVGVIIETPGHARPASLKQIAKLLRTKKIPIMPLGPIPTDISIGMDHISGAIGATIMGLEGCAHILSVVTRDEHSGGKPSIESTIEAVIAARMAAHIIDLHILGDDKEDLEVAKLRAVMNSCIAKKTVKECDRCGDVCPLKRNN
ncbi:MAG: phosphomethylpyrimidine synthase ThiC [Desulfitobacteriaceae bacterium]|nr:phosphomethylpyrimidine synthase ThiC [Desulfitobacteriaceae bacterium]